jgi:hypothetical protein
MAMGTGESVGRLSCHFCASYDVERLYLASVHLDSCACRGCGARWDEDPATGEYCGRSGKESGVTPRP